VIHVALLLLMLQAAANADLVSTISPRRNTPKLPLSTSGPADYPIFRCGADMAGGRGVAIDLACVETLGGIAILRDCMLLHYVAGRCRP
jgi:hypothetical protein